MPCDRVLFVSVCFMSVQALPRSLFYAANNDNVSTYDGPSGIYSMRLAWR